MQARTLADSNNAALTACAWALERALRYAAATAVVALAIATLTGGTAAERFATVAYVAAIAAAIAAVLRWFLPALPSQQPAADPRFPAAFAFALGLALLIVAGAAAASQSAAEVRVVALCFAITGAAALVHGGAFSAVRRRLADANYLTVAIRYCVIVALCSLGAAALFAGEATDALAKLAYASAFVAAALVTASLAAPLRAGNLAGRGYAEARRLLATPAAANVFARAAWYCVAAIVAGLALASLLPAVYAERFATAAYLASLLAAFAIGMRWLLRSSASDDAPPRAGWLRAAATVAAWLVAGAALAFSAVAEALLIVAALYAMAAAIRRAALTTAH
ncbi:MAG: hypothetical protein JO351_00645 [Candidatus Eremiobacteraeota bacterium]|nr:hypothetical protein [Candidatus Eremiobacteraeota bacterium]MBV9055131.1 hypothetical protein [Candidatus Eremiobacteraeota bacterium]